MSRFESVHRWTIAFAAFAALAGASHAAPTLDLGAYRGRVVYLDFWASWCGPCKQSFPWMQSLQRTYGRRGLVVIAVDLDRHRADAQRFLARFHPSFRIVYDPSGSFAQKYAVSGMPTTLLIDRGGRVRDRHIGFLPSKAAGYERPVERLLARK